MRKWLIAGVCLGAAMLAVAILWTRMNPDKSEARLGPEPSVASAPSPAQADEPPSTAKRVESTSAKPIVTPEPKPSRAADSIVVDATSARGIAGARLEFVLVRPASSWPAPEPITAPAITTDAEGGFVAPDWDFPASALHVSAAGYASLVVPPTFVSPKIHLKPASPLSGRVVDAEGRPIEGATVFAEGEKAMDAPIEVSRIATTDSAGRFTIEDASGESPLAVWARRGGYLQSRAGDVTAGASDVELKLRPAGARLFGQVVDHTGAPRSGSLLRMISSGVHGMTFDYAQTGVDGRFSFDSLPPGEIHAAAYWSLREGTHPYIVSALDLPATGEVELNLAFQPPIRASIRVIDGDTSLPLAGVGVSPAIENSAQTLTGPDGVATLDLLVSTNPPGGQALFVIKSPPGFAPRPPQLEGAHEVIDVDTPGGSYSHTVKLYRGHSISILALAPDGRTPLAGQFLSIGVQTETQQSAVGRMTDDTGRLNVTLAAGVPHQITGAGADWWMNEMLQPDPAIPQQDVVLIAKRLHRAAGRVEDEAEAPVEGVRVHLSSVINPSYVRQTTTGPEGTFEFQGVQGPEVVISTLATPQLGYASAEPRRINLETEDDATSIVLKVDKGIDLTLTVVDEAKNPIEGVSVTGSIRDGSTVVGHSWKSDANGRVVIGGLTEQSVMEHLSLEKTGFQSLWRQDLRVLEGDTTLVMTRSGGLTIAPMDADSGAPIPNFEYQIFVSAWAHNAGGPAGVVEDSSGIARIEQLPMGDRAMRVVVLERDSDQRLTGRTGAATFSVPRGKMLDIIVPVGKGATISGTVVDSKGSPIAEARVFQQGQSGITWTDRFGRVQVEGASPFALKPTTTDREGAFRIPNLPEGTYELLASANGSQTLEPVVVEVDRTLADPAPVQLIMPATGSVEVTVLDRNGVPMTGQTVMMERSPETIASTLKDSIYRFDAVPTGVWMVRMLSAGADASRPVEVVAGETVAITIDFSKTVKLTGDFSLDEKTEVPAGMSIFLVAGTGGNWKALKILPSGRYESEVFPDTYTLLIYSTSGQVALISDIVVAPEPAEQTRDFHLHTASVDIALVMPEGELPSPGVLLFDLKDGATISETYLTSSMEGERRHLPALPPGTYRVRYESRNKDFEATSDFQLVQPGASNVFVLIAKPAERSLNPTARVQKQLTNLGYDPGPVDGLMGPMTRNAIRSFQGDSGLPTSGEPDDATRQLLDQKAPLR